jgi:hypothetical protein
MIYNRDSRKKNQGGRRLEANWGNDSAAPMWADFVSDLFEISQDSEFSPGIRIILVYQRYSKTSVMPGENPRSWEISQLDIFLKSWMYSSIQ